MTTAFIYLLFVAAILNSYRNINKRNIAYKKAMSNKNNKIMKTVISEDQNTVFSNTVSHKFRKSTIIHKGKCSKCSLLAPCLEQSANGIEFPFPCNVESRRDNKSGNFKLIV